MIRLLRNEALKIKGSGIALVSLTASSVGPLLVLLMAFIVAEDPTAEPMSFYEFISFVLRFTVTFMAILIFTLISAELVSREFRYHTYNVQLTIPIMRTHLYFGKIAFISLVILCVFLCSYLFSIVASIFIGINNISYEVLFQMLYIYIKACLLVLPFSYFAVALVLVFKNTFVVALLNTLFFLSTILISKTDLHAVYPFTAPNRILFLALTDEVSTPIFVSYLSLLSLAIVSIVIGCYRMNKMEF